MNEIGTEGITVLVTFSGGHLARGIVQGLRASINSLTLIGVDSSKYHVHQSETDRYFLLPPASDPTYISALVHIAEQTGCDFIWPLHDQEIAKVAEAAERIPVRTWLPPLNVIAACQNKMAAYERLRDADVPVPATYWLSNSEDLQVAFEKLSGNVWLRANSGAGAKGAFRPKNLEQAHAWLEITEGYGAFTVAEYLPGPGDYSWESIWHNGELVAGQIETRIVRSSPGISLGGVRSRAVLLRDGPDEVTDISQAAVRAMMDEPDGIFRVDLMADTNGNPRVTEVDAGRFGTGGSVYWHQFGYNFALQALKIGMGGRPDHPTPSLNPLSKDMVSIGGVNRSLMFVPISTIDQYEEEYRALVEKSR